MNNKPSELKDAADYWRKVKSGELPAPGPNEISITVCTLDGAVSRIAALLAELEAKDKRIAELELDELAMRASSRAVHEAQENHINQQQDRIDSLEKTNAGLGRGLAAAEAKLATPVRLPEKFSMLHRTDFHEDYHSTMAFKSVEVFDAIRAAGFTFTVGDE